MKKSTTILTTVAALAAPGIAMAQVAGHVSLGVGLTANHYPAYGHGIRLGLGRVHAVDAFHTRLGVSSGFGFGLGFGFSYGSYDYGHGGYLYDYYGFDAQSLHHCRDYWHDPYCDCGPYHGWSHGWGWYDRWYEPVVFIGWPRIRFGWYAGGSYWHDPYDHRWGYGGWDPYWGYRGHRTVYFDYYRDYGYRRVATRSPLFGPRYKEDPRPYVHVTDNGPERPVSRAVPRGDRTDRLAGITSSRPSARRGGAGARIEPSTRTARPRVRARPEAGTNTNPSPSAKPRTRTGRAAPAGQVRTSRPDERSKPGTTVRPATGRSSSPVVRTRPQPAPRVRSTPSRGRVPTTRSAPVRSTRPSVRSAPRTRSAPPKVRSAPTSRSAPPKVRSAPKSRSAPPKVRSAPKSRSAPPKVRSAPKSRSAPPKARSAPPRRSPPKSSPPRRRGNQ